MVNVFEIPEILGLICEQVRQSDLARLLGTSRLFFEFVVPLVWSRLPESAPMILIRLLPGADEHLKNDPNDTPGNLRPLNTQSLVRFKLYVRHVKELARYRHNAYSNAMWDRLLKLVDMRPILPELEVLKVSLAMPEEIAVRDPVPFLLAHLSPTLVEIDNVHVPNVYASFGPRSLYNLISNIAQRCPRLHSLKLQNVGHRAAISSLRRKPLASSLCQLRHLRTLRLGEVVLEPDIVIAIGSIPHLESLSLEEKLCDRWANPAPDIQPLEISLPRHSFPALQHLEVKLALHTLPKTQTWSVTALVQRLASVSVRIEGEISQDTICDFARTICRSSPLVTSLFLKWTYSGDLCSLFSPALIDILAQLPLQYLCL
ncbi:hypothetical protein B0J17DRAFT_59201 [Rhizoctonia solani]|nr:hypothetical protein B0J17DRAFT_59201 [Rhizoctonia solani]